MTNTVKKMPLGEMVKTLEENGFTVLPNNADSQTVTFISILLDRSGSMQQKWETYISSINEYISTLKADKGNNYVIEFSVFDSETPTFRFGYVQPKNDVFSTDCVANIYAERPIVNFPLLSAYDERYKPRGMTPLLDAFYLVGKKVVKSPYARKLFVVITDGMENASRRYDRDDCGGIVTQLEKVNGQVVFLGEGLDAFAQYADMGLRYETSAQMGAKGFTADAARTFAIKSSAYASTGDSNVLNWTDQERKIIKDES